MSRHLMAKMRLEHKRSGRRIVAFDWKPSRVDFPHEEAYEAKLENGHFLRVMGSNDPVWSDVGWTWAITTPKPGDEDDNPVVTGGGSIWYGAPHAYATDHLPTAEHARRQAEEAYQKLFPLGTDTGSHDSGVDYSDLNKFMGEL